MLTVRQMQAAMDACSRPPQIMFTRDVDFPRIVRQYQATVRSMGLPDALALVPKWGVRIMDLVIYPSSSVPEGEVCEMSRRGGMIDWDDPLGVRASAPEADGVIPSPKLLNS